MQWAQWIPDRSSLIRSPGPQEQPATSKGRGLVAPPASSPGKCDYLTLPVPYLQRDPQRIHRGTLCD